MGWLVTGRRKSARNRVLALQVLDGHARTTNTPEDKETTYALRWPVTLPLSITPGILPINHRQTKEKGATGLFTTTGSPRTLCPPKHPNRAGGENFF